MSFQATFVDGPSRVKKKHKKTRTGCVTCKARRVKCGEERPICKNCRQLNRTCFYRPNPHSFRRSFSDHEDQDSPGPIPLPELALSPIERTPETTQLQQFCMNTSLAVFKNLGRPFEIFWTSAVPKLSLSEPCVAHIMVALAARQRASFYVSNAVERPHLIKLYNKHYLDALALLSANDGPTTEVILLCCLMFISMENVTDTVSNSFLHLRSGLQVLREWKKNHANSQALLTKSQSDLITNTLEPMFARFEAAVSPSIYRDYKEHPPSSLTWPLPQLPESFENLATARGTLYEIAQWTFSQGHHQMIFYRPQSEEFLETLEKCGTWRNILEKWTVDNPEEARLYKTAILALETNHQLLILLIKCTTLPNELLWGPHSNILEDMLRNIEFLEKEGPQDIPQRRMKMSLLPRMMPALFAVAMICRRRASRKRAVEFIQRFHSENHDDDCFAAVIANGVMQLEEEHEARSIFQLGSLETRIRPIKAELVPGSPGEIVLTYTRPFFQPLIADDPNLGPIITQAPSDTISLPWNCTEAPPARIVWLWPVIEFLRLAGSSGLVGPNTGHCLCKTYGALFALMR